MFYSDIRLHVEAAIFMARNNRREDDYNSICEDSVVAYRPRLRDSLMLTLGNWFVRLGTEMQARSIYTNLSGKQV